MKNINRILAGAVVLLVASTSAMTSAASAMMRPGPPPVAAAQTASGSGEFQAAQLLTQQLKLQAKLELAAQKKNIKLKTQAERQKACTARKNALTKRMANAVSWADKHKGVIDTAYSRVKAFHDSKNLDATNYASLTSAVDAAQTLAQASVDSLAQLDVNVDCSSQTVADSIGAFQQAVKTTRDSLKAYRTSLVKLIESMKGASAGTASAGDSPNNAGGQ